MQAAPGQESYQGPFSISLLILLLLKVCLVLVPGTQLWASLPGPAMATASSIPASLSCCLLAPWHTECSAWNCVFPLNALEDKE